jgi:hypothetical protein
MTQPQGTAGTWLWKDIDTGSKRDEFGYVTEAETKLEGYYTALSGGEKLPILNVFALISLAMGVKKFQEIFVGIVGFLPEWYVGGDGLDGMIGAMTGYQVYKRRYSTAAFPLVLEALRTLKDITNVPKGGTGVTQYVTKRSLVRAVVFLIGYFAGMSKVV